MPSTAALRSRASNLAPALAESVLPFALVLYLALRGGGFDLVVRSEVAIAIWWVLVLGAVAGLLPRARIGRVGWLGLGLLAAFAVWTALGIGWSESAERSAAELGRVASYLGVLALVVATQGKGGLMRTVYALAAAIGLVAAIALLSRLQPSWLPNNDAPTFFGEARQRLIYPVNSWNGLAALMAIGIPLVLVVAVESRRVLTAAIATAVLPIMVLTVFYTLSRGGVLAAAIALVTFIALYPRRLAALPTLALVAVGSGLLLAAAQQRSDLAQNVLRDTSAAQGDEMLVVTLVLALGVALTRVAIELAARQSLGPRLSVSRRATKRGFGAMAALILIVVLVAGLSGEIGDRWDEFKRPSGPARVTDGFAQPFEDRLASSSGNARYQYWQASLDATATDPLKGIGPGTFEYWWARSGTVENSGFVRDAHSLYIETLGELGVVGFLLISGFVVMALAFGASRCLARGSSRQRSALAAATAGCVAFAIAAATDWSWELAVLPVTFLILAGALFASDATPGSDAADGPAGDGGSETGDEAATNSRPEEGRAAAGLVTRAALALAGVAAIVVIGIPMLSTRYVAVSQERVAEGELSSALAEARAARDVQPYAAAPLIQEAQVLELAGALDDAAAAARSATEKEQTNWRTWFVLSRIERARGQVAEADLNFERARSLSPRSSVFE